MLTQESPPGQLKSVRLPTPAQEWGNAQPPTLRRHAERRT